MTLTQNSLNNHARWEVRWLGKRGIVRKSFEDDFGGALDLYTRLKTAGKKLVTLRSCNVGFAPPKHIVEHEVVRWEVVRHRGKRYKRKVVEYEDLMNDYNVRGIWWCPYCIRLRPFKQITDAYGRELMVCPVCDISNWDWYVKRWNPKAKTVEFRRTRGKSRAVGKRPRKSKRSRRTRRAT